jgi:hypothetical protein
MPGCALKENGKPGAERHYVTEAEKASGSRIGEWFKNRGTKSVQRSGEI